MYFVSRKVSPCKTSGFNRAAHPLRGTIVDLMSVFRSLNFPPKVRPKASPAADFIKVRNALAATPIQACSALILFGAVSRI